MKNFIIKYKVKILLTLFFAFTLLILNNNVFATVDYTYNNTIVTLPDLPFDTTEHPEYLIIFNRGESRYQVGYPQTNEHDKFFIVDEYGTCITYYLSGTSTKGQWVFWQCDKNLTDWGNQRVTSANYLQHISYVLYSTIDIYTDDTYTDFFFQKTPLVETPEIPEEETPKATTLQETMAQVEKGEVLKEIITLLPVILSVLVSLIALRKALKMLSDFLRAS